MPDDVRDELPELDEAQQVDDPPERENFAAYLEESVAMGRTPLSERRQEGPDLSIVPEYRRLAQQLRENELSDEGRARLRELHPQMKRIAEQHQRPDDRGIAGTFGAAFRRGAINTPAMASLEAASTVARVAGAQGFGEELSRRAQRHVGRMQLGDRAPAEDPSIVERVADMGGEALGGAIPTLGALIAAPFTGGTSLAAGGIGKGMMAYYGVQGLGRGSARVRERSAEEGDDRGLFQEVVAGALYGGIEASLTRVGLGVLDRIPAADLRRATNAFLDEGIKRNPAAMKRFLGAAGRATAASATASVEEGVQEGLVTIGQNMVDAYYELNYDGTLSERFGQAFRDPNIREAMMSAALVGPVVGPTAQFSRRETFRRTGQRATTDLNERIQSVERDGQAFDIELAPVAQSGRIIPDRYHYRVRDSEGNIVERGENLSLDPQAQERTLLQDLDQKNFTVRDAQGEALTGEAPITTETRAESPTIPGESIRTRTPEDPGERRERMNEERRAREEEAQEEALDTREQPTERQTTRADELRQRMYDDSNRREGQAIGGLVGARVAQAGHEGVLAREADGTFVIRTDQGPTVEVEGALKDPTTGNEAIGVTDLTPPIRVESDQVFIGDEAHPVDPSNPFVIDDDGVRVNFTDGHEVSDHVALEVASRIQEQQLRRADEAETAQLEQMIRAEAEARSDAEMPADASFRIFGKIDERAGEALARAQRGEQVSAEDADHALDRIIDAMDEVNTLRERGDVPARALNEANEVLETYTSDLVRNEQPRPEQPTDTDTDVPPVTPEATGPRPAAESTAEDAGATEDAGPAETDAFEQRVPERTPAEQPARTEQPDPAAEQRIADEREVLRRWAERAGDPEQIQERANRFVDARTQQLQQQDDTDSTAEAETSRLYDIRDGDDGPEVVDAEGRRVDVEYFSPREEQARKRIEEERVAMLPRVYEEAVGNTAYSVRQDADGRVWIRNEETGRMIDRRSQAYDEIVSTFIATRTLTDDAVQPREDQARTEQEYDQIVLYESRDIAQLHEAWSRARAREQAGDTRSPQDLIEQFFVAKDGWIPFEAIQADVGSNVVRSAMDLSAEYVTPHLRNRQDLDDNADVRAQQIREMGERVRSPEEAAEFINDNLREPGEQRVTRDDVIEYIGNNLRSPRRQNRTLSDEFRDRIEEITGLRLTDDTVTRVDQVSEIIDNELASLDPTLLNEYVNDNGTIRRAALRSAIDAGTIDAETLGISDQTLGRIRSSLDSEAGEISSLSRAYQQREATRHEVEPLQDLEAPFSTRPQDADAQVSTEDAGYRAYEAALQDHYSRIEKAEQVTRVIQEGRFDEQQVEAAIEAVTGDSAFTIDMLSPDRRARVVQRLMEERLVAWITNGRTRNLSDITQSELKRLGDTLKPRLQNEQQVERFLRRFDAGELNRAAQRVTNDQEATFDGLTAKQRSAVAHALLPKRDMITPADTQVDGLFTETADGLFADSPQEPSAEPRTAQEATENLSEQQRRAEEGAETPRQALRRVRAATAQYRLFNPDVPIEIVQTTADLPANVRSRAETLAENGQVVDGYFNEDTGQVYLVAQNLKPGHEMRTLLHEAVGHRGVRALLTQEQHLSLLRRVYKDMANHPVLRRVIQDRNLDVRSQDDRLVVADETIAAMAEGRIQTTLYDRIHSRVKSALRTMGMDTAITDSEIRVLLANAGQAARYGSRDGDVRVRFRHRFHIAPNPAHLIQVRGMTVDSNRHPRVRQELKALTHEGNDFDVRVQEARASVEQAVQEVEQQLREGEADFGADDPIVDVMRDELGTLRELSTQLDGLTRAEFTHAMENPLSVRSAQDGVRAASEQGQVSDEANTQVHNDMRAETTEEAQRKASGLWQEFKQGPINAIRRSFFTPAQRQVRLRVQELRAAGKDQAADVMNLVYRNLFVTPEGRGEGDTTNLRAQRKSAEFTTKLDSLIREHITDGETPQAWTLNPFKWLPLRRKHRQWQAKNEQIMQQLRDGDLRSPGARAFRNFFDEMGQYLVDAGALDQGDLRQNYVPQVYDDVAIRRNFDGEKGPAVDAFAAAVQDAYGYEAGRSREIAREVLNLILNDSQESFHTYLKNQGLQDIDAGPKGRPWFINERALDLDHKIISDYLVNNPMELGARYLARAVPYAEFTRVFGRDGGQEFLKAAENMEGMTREDLRLMEKTLQTQKGVYGTDSIGAGLRRVKIGGRTFNLAEGVMNVVALSTLPLAGVASISETGAIVLRHGVGGAARAWANTVTDRINNRVTGQRSEAEILGEQIGATAGESVRSIVENMAYGMNNRANTVMQAYFWATGLEPITRFQREAAFRAALSRTQFLLENGPRNQRDRRELSRINLPQQEGPRQRMLEFTSELEGTRGEQRQQIIDNNYELYRRYTDALNLMVNQVSVWGDPSNRPFWGSSKNPFLQAAFQLNSFIHAYREGPLAFAMDDMRGDAGRLTAGNMEDWMNRIGMLFRFLPLLMLQIASMQLREQILYDEEMREQINENRPTHQYALDVVSMAGLTAQSRIPEIMRFELGPALLGPTFTTFDELTQGVARTFETGEARHILESFVSTAPGISFRPIREGVRDSIRENEALSSSVFGD